MGKLDRSTVRDLLLKLGEMKKRIHNYDVGGACNMLDSTASSLLGVHQNIADQMYNLYDSVSNRLYPIDNRPQLVPELDRGIINLIAIICNQYLVDNDPSFYRLVKISKEVVLKSSRRDSTVYNDARSLLQLMYNYDSVSANNYSKEIDYCRSYGDYARLNRMTQEICGRVFKIVTEKIYKSFN